MSSFIVTDTADIGPVLDVTTNATAVVVGSSEVAQRVANTGTNVQHVDTGDSPVESYAKAVAAYLKENGAQSVTAVNTPGGRALATAAAVELGANIVTGAFNVSNGAVTRSIASIAEETLAIDGPVVVMVNTGATDAAGDGTVDSLSLAPSGISNVTATPSGEPQVDIATATRVVAVGRGVKAREDLALAESLAKTLGGVVACSRPLAEGLDWFPKSSYIGVSGLHIEPEIYVAVGISGQIQHIVGARDSNTIIAVNSDARAPIFKDADYGIVGDLYTVLPALTAAL